MTDGHQRKRMEWCLTHRDYNFDNVIFTDESRFQFYQCTRKRWAKFGNCQKMIPMFSPVVTVWDGLSMLGLIPLVCVTGNTCISSIRYCDILVKDYLIRPLQRMAFLMNFNRIMQHRTLPHLLGTGSGNIT